MCMALSGQQFTGEPLIRSWLRPWLAKVAYAVAGAILAMIDQGQAWQFARGIVKCEIKFNAQSFM